MGLIRVLLAISVIIAHSSTILGLNLIGGVAAVETFFMISGFYMALILNEKYIGENYSYKLFMKSRLMRLMPTYWVVLLLAVVSHNFEFIKNMVSLFEKYDFSTGLFMVFNNLFIIGQDIAMFLTVNAKGLLEFTSNYASYPVVLHKFIAIPPAWSLSLELMFYMMAPFICRLKTKYVALIFSASFLLKMMLKLAHLNFDPWKYRFFPAELCFFVGGILAYKIYQNLKHKDVSHKICWGFFLTILVMLLAYDKVYAVFPLFKYLYYAFFIVSIPFIFTLTKYNKFDNFIANLSYPIYIIHVEILHFRIFNSSIPFYNELNLLVIVLTAIALYVFIDKPVNEYRQTFIKKKKETKEEDIELQEATS